MADNGKTLIELEAFMVSAIGSSPASGFTPAPVSSTAGLEAQIIRYKKELSDCVNCASANTTEGKAAIAAAASKVSAAEARIKSIAVTNQSSPADAARTTSAQDSTAKTYEGGLTYELSAGGTSGAALKFSDASTGSRVDVTA